MQAKAEIEASDGSFSNIAVHLTNVLSRFNPESLIESLLLIMTVLGSLVIFFIIFFIFKSAAPVLWASGVKFLTSGGWDQHFALAWQSAASPTMYRFGALELLAGTFYTTAGALVISTLLGLGCAIFLAEMSPNWLRGSLQNMLGLLAGIPPVIYGLIGIVLIVPFIREHMVTNELALRMIKICALEGSSILAGIIVLGIMVTPTFALIAAEAISSVPRSYKEASLALGVSHWHTVTRIMIPAARRGIITGAVLAAGVAVGEFVAMAMVAGGTANLPSLKHGWVFLLEPVRPLAATIFINSEVLGMKVLESALFACAAVLLVISMVLSLIAQLVQQPRERQGR